MLSDFSCIVSLIFLFLQFSWTVLETLRAIEAHLIAFGPTPHPHIWYLSRSPHWTWVSNKLARNIKSTSKIQVKILILSQNSYEKFEFAHTIHLLISVHRTQNPRPATVWYKSDSDLPQGLQGGSGSGLLRSNRSWIWNRIQVQIRVYIYQIKSCNPFRPEKQPEPIFLWEGKETAFSQTSRHRWAFAIYI